MSIQLLPQDIFLCILEKIQYKRDYIIMCIAYKRLYGENVPKICQRSNKPYNINYYGLHIYDIDLFEPNFTITSLSSIEFTYNKELSYLNIEDDFLFNQDTLYQNLDQIDDVKMLMCNLEFDEIMMIKDKYNFDIQELRICVKHKYYPCASDIFKYFTIDGLKKIYLNIYLIKNLAFILDGLYERKITDIDIVFEYHTKYECGSNHNENSREMNYVKNYLNNLTINKYLRVQLIMSLILYIDRFMYYDSIIKSYTDIFCGYLSEMRIIIRFNLRITKGLYFNNLNNLRSLIIHIDIYNNNFINSINVYISDCELLEYIAIIFYDDYKIHKPIKIELSNLYNLVEVYTNIDEYINIVPNNTTYFKKNIK